MVWNFKGQAQDPLVCRKETVVPKKAQRDPPVALHKRTAVAVTGALVAALRSSALAVAQKAQATAVWVLVRAPALLWQ